MEQSELGWSKSYEASLMLPCSLSLPVSNSTWMSYPGMGSAVSRPAYLCRMQCTFYDPILHVWEASGDQLSAAQANRSLMRTLDVFREAVLLVDTAQPDWRILYANEAWALTTGALT